MPADLTKAVFPTIESNLGQATFEGRIVARVNEFTTVEIGFFETPPGAEFVTGAETLARFKEVLAAARQPLTAPDVDATLGDGENQINIRGFRSNTYLTAGDGSFSRSRAALHESFVMDSIQMTAYPVRAKDMREAILQTTGSLTSRIAKLARMIVSSGERELQNYEHPFRSSMQAAAARNAQFLPGFYSMLQASEDTIGWEEIGQLAEGDPLSQKLNEFLIAILRSDQNGFFQVIRSIADAFQLWYAPALVSGQFGQLINKLSAEDGADAETINFAGSATAMSAGSPFLGQPTNVQVTNLPEINAPTPEALEGLGFNTLLLKTGTVVYPRELGHNITTQQMPSWLPKTPLVGRADEGNTEADRFSVEGSVADEEQVQLWADHIEKLTPYINKFARGFLLQAQRGIASTTISGPLQLDPAMSPGKFVNVNMADGGTVSGVIEMVTHELRIMPNSSAGRTQLQLSFLL